MGKPIYIEEPTDSNTIGKVTSGFCINPMYPRDMYENLLSRENIEILEKFFYPTYSYMGYKPMYSTNMNAEVPTDEFENIKNIKFAFEDMIYKDIDLNQEIEHNGKKIKLHELVDIYRDNFLKNSIDYKNNTLKQIENGDVNIYPVLQPDERYLVNTIYENMNSLPDLNDINVDFIEKDNHLITEFDWHKHHLDEFKRVSNELSDANSKLKKIGNHVNKVNATIESNKKELIEYKNKLELKEKEIDKLLSEKEEVINNYNSSSNENLELKNTLNSIQRDITNIKSDVESLKPKKRKFFN